MRAFSRDAKSSYYKFQSLPRNFTQQKRLQQLHTLKDNEIKVGIYKYSTVDQLGKGYSSKVYKGVQIQNIHKRYAIKAIQLKKFRGSSLEMLEAEIQIHRGLVHQNIVRLYQVIKTPYFYYIILEYCPHGNLHQYIRQKKKLSQSNASEIMDQVLAGAKHLMEQGVIHRDLKPANILRSGNKWKLSDFGFSVRSKYGFKDRMNVGTPLYMSPQSLKKSYYSAKTDIYSLGIILYEMLQGKTPFQSRNQKELLQKMKEVIAVPSHIRDQKIRQFIERCCQLNEVKRMTREQFLQFQIRSHQQCSGSDKDSLLADSMSRAIIPSRRPSILSDQIRSQQQVLRQHIETLYNQFLLAKHFYSCIKNIDSFLIEKESKEHLILLLFKLLLKLVRFLCDKKKNHFNFKYWDDLITCKSYNQLYQKMLDQSEIYQKEYLEQIKNKDIKIIRSVNRRFPDLCHNNALTHKFYYDLHDLLIGLIRQQNHEILIIFTSQQNKQKPKDQQINKQKSLVSSAVGTENVQKSKAEEQTIQSHLKYQLKVQNNHFAILNGDLSPLLMQPKRQSRLQIKKSTKKQEKIFQSKNQIKSASKIEEQISSNCNATASNVKSTIIPLNDKYQALESLYTIYRICQLRYGNDDNKQIPIEKLKVLQNYTESKLEAKQYLNLRRLLRNV